MVSDKVRGIAKPPLLRTGCNHAQLRTGCNHAQTAHQRLEIRPPTTREVRSKTLHRMAECLWRTEAGACEVSAAGIALDTKPALSIEKSLVAVVLDPQALYPTPIHIEQQYCTVLGG